MAITLTGVNAPAVHCLVNRSAVPIHVPYCHADYEARSVLRTDECVGCEALLVRVEVPGISVAMDIWAEASEVIVEWP